MLKLNGGYPFVMTSLQAAIMHLITLALAVGAILALALVGTITPVEALIALSNVLGISFGVGAVSIGASSTTTPPNSAVVTTTTGTAPIIP